MPIFFRVYRTYCHAAPAERLLTVSSPFMVSVGVTKSRAFAAKCGQNFANLLCRNNISRASPENYWEKLIRHTRYLELIFPYFHLSGHVVQLSILYFLFRTWFSLNEILFLDLLCYQLIYSFNTGNISNQNLFQLRSSLLLVFELRKLLIDWWPSTERT